jgi:hypothetical protein
MSWRPRAFEFCVRLQARPQQGVEITHDDIESDLIFSDSRDDRPPLARRTTPSAPVARWHTSEDDHRRPPSLSRRHRKAARFGHQALP